MCKVEARSLAFKLEESSCWRSLIWSVIPPSLPEGPGFLSCRLRPKIAVDASQSYLPAASRSIFLKYLDAPAFSWPRHNWVARCPANFRLISTPALYGSGHGSVVPLSTLSTTAPMLSSAGDPAPSPSSWGSERISLPWAASRRAWPWTPCLAALDTAADHRAQARWQQQLPPAQEVQLLPSASRFQTRWFLHHSSRISRESAGEPFFSYPAGRFLHAPGWQVHRSLHKGSPRSARGNHLRGSTSDLIRSSS